MSARDDGGPRRAEAPTALELYEGLANDYDLLFENWRDAVRFSMP